MKVSWKKVDLQLKDPFTISRGTVTVQPAVIVQVEHDGLVGLGEATTNEYYGVTAERIATAIESVSADLSGYTLENPAELWSDLDGKLSSCRFAQCALDCAVWDLYAQMHSVPLWKLWGLDATDPCPPTCFTIGIDSPEEMLRKMYAKPNWPVYKIKVGEDGGLDLVRHLRAGTDSTFRVDANCAWSADTVEGNAQALSEMDVELIEQPLPAGDYEAMRKLKGKCALPLMADESCQVETDIDRCIDAFDAVNIKLVKCGGLTPARRMLTRAKQNGLKVMVGCMTESSIGIAPGVHLLPLLDFADLDGAMLLAEDIAEGIEWNQGYCKLPTSNGLGVRIV